MKKEKNNILKIRSSAASKIMGAVVGSVLTDKQAEEIITLQAKPYLTEKQTETLARLALKRDAPPQLNETGKSYIEELFIQHRYGRQRDLINRYVTKGLAVEEDSITLFSRWSKQFYVKNEVTLENDFITGTPDMFLKTGDKIDCVIDVKSSWDIWTFMRSKRELNQAYYWQVQSYMALTGASSAKVAYCLVDLPEPLLNDEKRRLMYSMGALTDESPEYLKAAAELELQLTFRDIPIEERIHVWTIDRNEADINRLYDRVLLCREYFKSLSL